MNRRSMLHCLWVGLLLAAALLCIHPLPVMAQTSGSAAVGNPPPRPVAADPVAADPPVSDPATPTTPPPTAKPAPSGNHTDRELHIPTAARLHYFKGCQFMDQEKYVAAAAEFTQAIALAPAWAQPYQARAAAYLNLGKLDDALEDANTALRLDPTDPVAYLVRGIVHLTLGHVEEAIADLEMHLALMPDSPVRAEVEGMLAWLYAMRDEESHREEPAQPLPVYDL